MASPELAKLLKSLDKVKQDFTCGYCKKICTDPVTLSVCFDMICASHFEGLKNCPTCNASLENCKIFVDEGLKAAIPATKALDELFRQFRVDKENSSNNFSTLSDTKKRNLVKEKYIGALLQELPSQSTDKNTKKVSKNAKTVDKLNSTVNSNISTKNVEKKNTKGETALHVACRLGKIDKIKELLTMGANPNTKDNAGWTPLHEVVQNGQYDSVQLLLEHNALIDVPGQGNETPLHEAIRYGHKDIITLLVKYGADTSARNIKGETPLDLANGEIKTLIDEASEEVLQTQSLNVTRLASKYIELDSEDMKVHCVSQQRSIHSKLKLLAKRHSNLTIEAKLTNKVTHLIVDTDNDLICTSTLEVLQATVTSTWVISSNWIVKSTEDELEPFDQYEVKGVGTKHYNGPKNARINKYKQLPGIFDGCHFYLHNLTTKYEVTKQIVLTKAILSKLITDAGGIVLRRVPNPESIPEQERLVPYHAKRDGKLKICSHYIIFKDVYEPMYNMQHLKALPIGWLIECMEKYELCEPW